MSRQRVSQQWFCGTCGEPAVKPRDAPRPQWQLPCGHGGGPVRVGAKRAGEITERFLADREAMLARLREQILVIP